MAPVRALAVGVGGAPPQLYVSNTSEVVALDPATGVTRWRRKLREGLIRRMALATDMRPGVVVASDSTVHVLDAGTGMVIQTIDTDLDTIWELRLSELNGRRVVFLTAEQEHRWATRIWDLDIGQEIQTTRRFALHNRAGYKTLRGLAVLQRGRRIRFAFAGAYSQVMVADFSDAMDDAVGQPFSVWSFPKQAGNYVHALALGQYGERTLLAAGTDYGAIIVWDFDKGISEGYQLNAHMGLTECLCFGMINGETVLIGGGSDAVLSLWTPALEPISRIEIGDKVDALAWMPPDRLAVGTESGVLMLRFIRFEVHRGSDKAGQRRQNF